MEIPSHDSENKKRELLHNTRFYEISENKVS